MEYSLNSGPIIKERYKIGFLDDNQNNDFHIQTLTGIIEAAKEFDVDIVRFGYYSSHIAYKFPHQVDKVVNHIEQYELDGLMFLDRTKAAETYSYTDFFNRLGSLPVLSIGSIYENIPNVCFAGEEYIREIVVHLIEVHHFTKIAFIEHHRHDKRKEAYENMMRQYGIYDPLLCVSEQELRGLDNEKRNIKAVEVLLDKRNMELDAIITLNIVETGYLLRELDRRGIKVPGDIAVTSYEEDGPAWHSSPGYTTVYYPWWELGYYACRNMVRLLKHGSVPMSASLTDAGRVIYRSSCGCMPYSAITHERGKLEYAPYNLADITQLEIDEIVRSLYSLLYNTGIHFEKLAEAFISSYRSRNNSIFLSELVVQLRRVTDNKGLGNLVAVIRKFFYPYLLREIEGLLWAGELFQQAQILVSERVASVHGIRVLKSKMVDNNLQEVSQSLLVNFSLQNLTESLARGLQRLEIPGCQIFISSSILNNTEMDEHLFDNCVHVFKYKSGRQGKIPGIAESLRQQLPVILAENKEHITLAYLLHVTDEIMGVALFEPGPMDESVYHSLSTHISTALRGIMLMNRLNITYKNLVEHAQKEGMADIATNILHNIGNILNSVNVSVHLIEESAKLPVADDLIMAGKLLQDNMNRLEDFICNDVKGKMLMRFFLKLGAVAGRLQNQFKYNFDRIQNKVNAINDAIAAQQSYAGIDMRLEELFIEPILRDAIKIYQATFDRYGIFVEKNCTSYFKALIHRSKLFFILISIISNAKDAMTAVEGLTRKLTVSMYENNTGKYIRIDDTGTGIPEGFLNKVFEYGFTTKTGKYGDGLYSCANYMDEIGGSIRAESKGTGKGAAFILRFP